MLRVLNASWIVQPLERRVFGVIHILIATRGVRHNNEYEARGSTQQMRDWQNAVFLQTYIGRRATQQCSTFKYVSACTIRKITLKKRRNFNVITLSWRNCVYVPRTASFCVSFDIIFMYLITIPLHFHRTTNMLGGRSSCYTPLCSPLTLYFAFQPLWNVDLLYRD
jgi:hypothetical protein